MLPPPGCRLPPLPSECVPALPCYINWATCSSPSLAVWRRHLHIPLVQAERAWAYAMDLKSQLEETQVGPHGGGPLGSGVAAGGPL